MFQIKKRKRVKTCFMYTNFFFKYKFILNFYFHSFSYWLLNHIKFYYINIKRKLYFSNVKLEAHKYIYIFYLQEKNCVF